MNPAAAVSLLVLCSLWAPSTGLLWGGDSGSRRESTTFPSPTRGPHNLTWIDSCPLRQCRYRDEGGVVSFACPMSGCTNISSQIMSNVQDLRLQDNVITSIPVLHLVHLRKLDLADNNISVIDERAFNNLQNLTMLYLSNNKISNLKREHFTNLARLQYLYLDQNRLTVLDNNVFFPALSSIERIDLSTNQITTIDETTFALLNTMKFLHLERNKITNLKDHFQMLDNLEELTLSMNQITEIQPSTFSDLKNLRTLDLGYNRIKHLSNLSFGLDHPGISNSRLQRLVLRNNSIDSIESHAFWGLNSLQVLHLEYNPLQGFPTCYFPNSLEEIQLHHMTQLTMVPARAFANLTNLKNIKIYANPKLSVISPDSFSTPFKHLKLLDLSRNNLRTMSEHVLGNWKAVPNVDLSGNPWHCDCKIRWMKEVYMNHADRETIRCQTPRRLSGKSIARVAVEDFVCGIEVFGVSMRERTGIGLMVLTSIALVVFLGLFLYKCRKSVFPCRYGQTSKYRALYNPKGDEEDDIRITQDITVSENEKKIIQAQSEGPAPAPVAL